MSDEKILRWEPGKTPFESKLLWYWNGVTGEFIDYEHPERNRPPATPRQADPKPSDKLP
jgi:hypothetical protein